MDGKETKYFRAGVSNWTFEWDSGSELITQITQEFILSYPDGRTKIILNNASISEALCKDLSKEELENLKLTHDYIFRW